MSYPYKILILDDEKLVTEPLKNLLEIEGFEDAVVFNEPKKALEYLKNNEREVIISDFMMDEMNGIEFLTLVKKMYPHASTILLTGYADKENAIKGINEAGLYKYIEKPWDNDSLIINIKNAYERAVLVKNLEEKNKELSRYSEKLEEQVKLKTADLQSANDELTAVISDCADGIMVVTTEGEIVSVNPSAETMFGLSAAIIKEKKATELFESKNETLEDVIKSGKNTVLRETEIENRVNGVRIPVEISCSYIPENGNKPKYVLVIRDTTVQKEAERLREDFISALTHDLRTPALAAINTLEYFLNGKIGEINEKQHMFLSTLKKSNEDMLGMVNTLLEVYKHESGHFTPVKTEFSFSDLLDECIESVKPLAQAKNQTIEKVYDKIDAVYADRNEIRRVIMNLIGNAVKYTQEGGLIEVKSEADKTDLRFSVKDNGEGIYKQDIPKLFKRFSRGTKEKRSISTGLGLYLSKQIIDAHSGKIWLESDKGKGSEFFFVLFDSVKLKETDKVWKV